ncbi:hypothetical protein [Anabaena sp. CCY 0017]|uniref:hypothetical protein n=1 Tax=Anabaena sp. CCY 0017 TaxID=3103866 RepID=UPI0039C6FAFD
MSQKNSPSLLLNSRINDGFIHKDNQPNLRDFHYRELSKNALKMNEIHSVLLESRQETLHQISSIIQQQLELYQTLFEESSDLSEYSFSSTYRA